MRLWIRFNLGLEILLFDRDITLKAQQSLVSFNLGLEILLFDRKTGDLNDVREYVFQSRTRDSSL